MKEIFFELPLFVNLLILLVTARLLGEIFERFKQPAMIGEIIAGIILGPTILNLIHRTEEIQVVSELVASYRHSVGFLFFKNRRRFLRQQNCRI